MISISSLAILNESIGIPKHCEPSTFLRHNNELTLKSFTTIFEPRGTGDLYLDPELLPPLLPPLLTGLTFPGAGTSEIPFHQLGLDPGTAARALPRPPLPLDLPAGDDIGDGAGGGAYLLGGVIGVSGDIGLDP